MNISSFLSSFSRITLLTLTCVFTCEQVFAGPDTRLDSLAKPDRVPTVTVKNTGQSEFLTFKGDEVFYRPDKKFGFKLNLKGFTDLRAKVSGISIVCFAVREDSVGMTLAHLYVNTIGENDSLPTARFYADRLFGSISADTTVILSTLSQKQKYGFETLEYDRSEVWPQPDPNNPGKMFDSTLVRRHLNAITTYRGAWIELHLSKTEYHTADSVIFDELLNTFEITENFERKKITPVNIKSTKTP